ncbi:MULTISPECIES: hypothetical protein [unclassified Pseudofrankia]|uniref:hypothetical protein n=1 Tax=unclassified Pseudofrankia TaxID=2994372 RepID=UPI0008DA1234|nr:MULTISPECIES: hypothetical protein [unclassified Pseudofrankia]MDT3441094.1 hypothetical protein [Pseudofrankia sp. BMG5.37]OHV54290.1 hypothetical protein BCD48_09555 [Pseudofrankia sp. BMG5.36]
MLSTGAPAPGRDQFAPRPATAYLEPSPYRPPSEAAEIADLLRGHGYQVSTATRFHDHDPRTAAIADWDAALAAELVVADVSGPEAPPGAAAMIGAAAATGRTALVWQPVPAWTFSPGREPNWRNLMIQYAVGGVFQDTAGLLALMGT